MTEGHVQVSPAICLFARYVMSGTVNNSGYCGLAWYLPSRTLCNVLY